MNLRSVNAGEESSKWQVQQRKKIGGPFSDIKPDEENLYSSSSESLEERKVQSNQIIYAGSWNFKT